MVDDLTVVDNREDTGSIDLSQFFLVEACLFKVVKHPVFASHSLTKCPNMGMGSGGAGEVVPQHLDLWA